MKLSLVAGLVACYCLGAAQAVAQESDDEEFEVFVAPIEAVSNFDTWAEQLTMPVESCRDATLPIVLTVTARQPKPYSTASTSDRRPLLLNLPSASSKYTTHPSHWYEPESIFIVPCSGLYNISYFYQRYYSGKVKGSNPSRAYVALYFKDTLIWDAPSDASGDTALGYGGANLTLYVDAGERIQLRVTAGKSPFMISNAALTLHRIPQRQ